MTLKPLQASSQLCDVRYEIRGPLAHRAHELEQGGADIIKLNIGNPGAFGFRMPETMRQAMVENLQLADAYCHQKGIFPAREAVVMQQQNRGIMDVTAEEVFVGNGVSELIMHCMRALLNNGDQVLVPSPDYPLWTASVVIHGGVAKHYDCLPDNGFQPDIEQMRSLINDRTKAIVVINPNNPTGAVYSRETLQAIVDLAEEHGLVLFADEIYDGITYDDAEYIPLATMVHNTLIGTFGGLSKVYRACGVRVGWVSFAGEKAHAKAYLEALELLASLRLCSNVPGQWAVQTALGGYQSIHEMVVPGGRLYDSRQVIIERCELSPYLSVIAPQGAIYAFVQVDTGAIPGFNDDRFAMDLLDREHVLVCPGSSFNVRYHDHIRITLLPDTKTMRDVFDRMERVLQDYSRNGTNY